MMFTSIDDVPVTEIDQEIPAVPVIAKAITTADEEGILAKMMRAPNAPEPAVPVEAEVSAPAAAPTRGPRPKYAYQRIAADKARRK